MALTYIITAQNTVISTNFMVWEFCRNAQFCGSPKVLPKAVGFQKIPRQEIS